MKKSFSHYKYSTMATGCTWAQVARKKTPPALPTECTVNLEQYATPQHLPPSSSCYSAFVPLPFNFANNWMLDTLATLPNTAIGIVPRQDISLIEVCFANKEAQLDFLSSTITTTHFTIPVIGHWNEVYVTQIYYLF